MPTPDRKASSHPIESHTHIASTNSFNDHSKALLLPPQRLRQDLHQPPSLLSSLLCLLLSSLILIRIGKDSRRHTSPRRIARPSCHALRRPGALGSLFAHVTREEAPCQEGEGCGDQMLVADRFGRLQPGVEGGLDLQQRLVRVGGRFGEVVRRLDVFVVRRHA